MQDDDKKGGGSSKSIQFERKKDNNFKMLLKGVPQTSDIVMENRNFKYVLYVLQLSCIFKLFMK